MVVEGVGEAAMNHWGITRCVSSLSGWSDFTATYIYIYSGSLPPYLSLSHTSSPLCLSTLDSLYSILQTQKAVQFYPTNSNKIIK